MDNRSKEIHDGADIANLIKEREVASLLKEMEATMVGMSKKSFDLDPYQEDGESASVELKMKKKKALLEFRCLVEDAILGNYLLGKPDPGLSPKEAAMQIENLRKITIWGVPLSPTRGHQGTDTVLLKFLKSRDFKVRDAFEMLRKTLKWRRQYNVDSTLEEGLDPDLEKFMYFNCKDREGRPLFFNVYGTLKDRELRKKLFDTEDICEKFLRLKVRSLEKGLKQVSFKPGGASSLIQIIDLRNSQPSNMNELRVITKKTWMLLQENYPGLIYRNIVINAPFWYHTTHIMTFKFLTQRTKKKFVFARRSHVTKTLLKFINPENLPVEYGGLYRDNDDEFSPEEKASDFVVGKNKVGCIKIPVHEAGVTVIWDITVMGWDVSYKEEFIPDDEGSYKVLLQNEKDKKGGGSIRNSFYISEPGEIVISIDNPTHKTKKVFYRFKDKPTVPTYVVFKK